jgi:hypothetical protein
MNGIVPGQYQLFSWQDVVPGAYQNEDYMRRFERAWNQRYCNAFVHRDRGSPPDSFRAPVAGEAAK